MSTFENIEQVRAYFKHDTFATSNGMTVEEWSPDRVVCAVKVTENHKNAIGGVMGGVIYTLADLAFAVMANTDHNPTVAVTTTVNFLSMPKGERLFAAATRVKSGRTTGVYQVAVTDDTGREVALFTGTGYKLQNEA